MKKNNKYIQATRKMLYNYSERLAELRLKERELEYIKDNDGIGCTTYDLAGGQKSNTTHPKVEQTGDNNIDNERRLQSDINSLKMNIDKIDTVLDILNEIEKVIIHMRYIDVYKKEWEYVACALGYSVRQAQRIEKNALTRITSLLFGVKSYDLPLIEYIESKK